MDQSSDRDQQNPGHPGWGTPQVPPSPAPPRKSSKVGWVAGFIGLFIVGATVTSAASNTTSTGSTGSLSSRSVATGHTVTYKVEGTTNMASITYSNSQGDTSQQSDIDVPIRRKDTSTWSQSDGGYGIRLNGMESGDFLYISAQNSKDSGSITCIIEVDGIVVKTNTSRGGYTIATCSGRL